MKNNPDTTSNRKKEHLELCLTDKVAFKNKTSGFEFYDFIHCAATEVEIKNINLSAQFFEKKIDYPFLISCMTGGTEISESINAQLALTAEKLNIPIGVGSQRQALESGDLNSTYSVIRQNAPTIPVLANIGAAELVKYKGLEPFYLMIEMIKADGIFIHLNPLQELLQPEGTPNFIGLIKRIKKLSKNISVPIIIKEVGSGISYESAKKLLDSGVKGIDVAGAGGTSWAAVEILRRNNEKDNLFWDWGLPTSYCIKEVFRLKRKYKFTLIGSGGINSAIDCAKALALGADIVASARTILQSLDKNGINGPGQLIKSWFDDVKKIMFLTGSSTLKEFRKNKIMRKDFLY